MYLVVRQEALLPGVQPGRWRAGSGDSEVVLSVADRFEGSSVSRHADHKLLTRGPERHVVVHCPRLRRT